MTTFDFLFTPEQRALLLKGCMVGEVRHTTATGDVLFGVKVTTKPSASCIGHPFGAKLRDCRFSECQPWPRDGDEEVCVGPFITEPDADGLAWVLHKLNSRE